MKINLRVTNYQFSYDSVFVTGSRNGSVSLWSDGKIEKSAKIFDEWTLVIYRDGQIFAASKNKAAVELDMTLNIIKKFDGRNSQPVTIDANQNYFVVGYNQTGAVDVHCRKELAQNGSHPKRMVKNLLKSLITIELLFRYLIMKTQFTALLY